MPYLSIFLKFQWCTLGHGAEKAIGCSNVQYYTCRLYMQFLFFTCYRVDMNKYPNLAKVPWYQAILEEGDCLYVPYLWLHHVCIIL